MSLDRNCRECGRVWRTYTYTPCDKDGDCWECDMFALIDHPREHGEAHDDADEVASYQCAHGVEYDVLCRGCGAKVSGWGMGAAGFGELCGCDNEVAR